MKFQFQSLTDIFKKTFSGWLNDDPFRQSAIIAYYAIFSLPALLVLIINVVGFFFQKEVISGEITRQITGVMGADTAQQISKIVENANQTKAGLVPGIIAIVLLITGATGVFVQLQIVLNQIWNVKQKSQNGVLAIVKNRIFSFGLILAIGFLLLISLVVSSVLASVSHWLEAAFSPAVAYLMYAIEFVVSLGVVSMLFALMFKYLPDVKIAWRSVWMGALLTGFLFIIGKYGLSLYFGKATPGSVYGAAGSIILVLLWVSYSSVIMFFGAEFTKQYAIAKKHSIEVKDTAEAIDNNVEYTLSHAGQKNAPPHVAMAGSNRNQPLDKKAIDKLINEVNAEQIKPMDEDELQKEINRRELHLIVQEIIVRDRIANFFRHFTKFSRKIAQPVHK
jgi:membrane protein